MTTALTVLLYASIAALSAVPGAFVRWSSVSGRDRWIGWAHALAAGAMLGTAFVLTAESIGPPLAAAAGGLLGVLAIVATHRLTRLDGLDLSRPNRLDPTAARRLLAVHAWHGCAEGVAIGVAMALDQPLGIFVALAIALHNMPEAALLKGAAGGDGPGTGRAMRLAVLSNAGQPAFAVGSWMVLQAFPSFLPWMAGFALGALLNLVLTELLPASYRHAGSTSIALVATVALSLVVLLGGQLP
jgi:zinc transporter ZupT